MVLRYIINAGMQSAALAARASTLSSPPKTTPATFFSARQLVTLSCVDPRKDERVMVAISNAVFGGDLENLRTYQMKSVGSKIYQGSPEDLDQLLEKTGERQVLLVVHNDCAAVKNGIVSVARKVDNDGREDFDYEGYARQLASNVLKGSLRSKVATREVNLVIVLLKHNESDPTNPALYKIDIMNPEFHLGRVSLKPVKENVSLNTYYRDQGSKDGGSCSIL